MLVKETMSNIAREVGMAYCTGNIYMQQVFFAPVIWNQSTGTVMQPVHSFDSAESVVEALQIKLHRHEALRAEVIK